MDERGWGGIVGWRTNGWVSGHTEGKVGCGWMDGWMREGRKDGKKEGRMSRWEGQLDTLTTGFPPRDSVTGSRLHRLLAVPAP